MKKLVLHGFWLSLVFEILFNSLSFANSAQVQSDSPSVKAHDATCGPKLQDKKAVKTKAKIKKEQCITAPKQCYKQSPVTEKPSFIKLPVLFPISREVAFEGNIALPEGSLYAVVHSSSSQFSPLSY
ncbi:hypothetical protein [Adhaeribacter radiodurans]|uniref:Uncharacterized protein n=1 Tax=Adhaeribacter radiodurans TaxID=2745197 RepID=A0A7L7L9K6_9BACT|nr:hypothetical protein [Adhaeribacter radiodurans]QMU29414.1 hypothetical protein HUW48_15815 [Adhaeribacter radiodurans]